MEVFMSVHGFFLDMIDAPADAWARGFVVTTKTGTKTTA
ncbi:hypothetical protein MTBLM5_480019 [Magnetospirillum sp. LM-5]|nr:hypothetical protein MTBLM5_480019 [Magnetospirillum sp. LM-5]